MRAIVPFALLVLAGTACLQGVPESKESVAQPALLQILLRRDEKISVEFKDGRLIDLLRRVSELYGLNMVIPAKLAEQKVSVSLRNVGWHEVFDAALVNTDCHYVESGNLVILQDEKKAAGEVIRLRNALAAEHLENLKYRELVRLLVDPPKAMESSPLRESLRSQVRELNWDPAVFLSQLKRDY